MFHRNIFVIFLVVLTISHCFKNEFEPACSKFHYEEQLLEKMIRLEIKFETLMDNVEKLETSIREERRVLNEERNAGKQNLEKWMREKEDVFEDNMQEMGKRLSDKNESISALMQDVGDALGDMESKLIRMSTDFVELRNETLGEITSKINALKKQTVAFEAHKVSKLNHNTNEKIVFTDVKLNERDGYDNSTGVFTVPESGIYLLMVQFCLVNEKNMYFDFIMNDNILNSAMFYRHQIGNYACYSSHTAVRASTKNRIWIGSSASHSSHTLYNGPRLNSYLDYYKRLQLRNQRRRLQQRFREEREERNRNLVTYKFTPPPRSPGKLTMLGINVQRCTSTPQFWCSLKRFVP